MNAIAEPAPMRRYRRRIVGLGLALAAVVAAIGAPVYVRSIERDLERRVPEQLTAAGVSGVSASFSGQDGTIRCASPLPDPERALDAAYEVDGVRTVNLDRSCRVSSAPTVDPTTPATTTPEAAAPTVPATEPDDGAVATEPDAGSPDDPASTTVAAFASVGEIVRTSPRFSILSSLIAEAELGSLLDGADPITVFAPDNDALEDLTADVLAELRTEPDLLADVLRHHIVAGEVPLAALVDGERATLHDGETLIVTATNGRVTVGDATVLDGDLVAGNGVVHAIDQVLLPADLDLRALDGLPELVAILRTGRLDLAGPAADEATRAALLAAAETNVDPVNVTHDIVLDPDDGVDGASADAIGELLAVVPVTLTSGTVRFDGTSVLVRGTVVDDAARDVIGEVAARVGATLELVERPTADDDTAAQLMAEMNAVVAESPLDFQPGSADLAPGTEPTLDVLAALAKQTAGVVVIVEGHTDSDGTAESNLVLSDRRAEVVLLQLVARGVPPGEIEHRGLGDSAPVLTDGVEDKAASRRVEFSVVLA